MEVNIISNPLRGTITAIPSKSHVHRLLICAAFSDSPTEILLSHSSEDIDATVGCLCALGAKISRNGNSAHITPIENVPEIPLLDCNESGSTFRFLLPIASILGKEIRFTGRGLLPSRPIGDLKTAMESGGVAFSGNQLPFAIRGKLNPGAYRLPGDVSSQYLTGLLLALPLLGEPSSVVLESSLQSKPYIEITLAVLRTFGTEIFRKEESYVIPPCQCGRYRSPGTIRADGDWSNAAFFLCAGALGEPVTIEGLSQRSTQGDKAVLDALCQFGARVECAGDCVTVSPATLHGCVLDVDDTPDLAPILSIVAACAQGETRINRCARLRLKESDRLKTTVEMIRSLGGNAEENGDTLVIHGGTLSGGTVSGAGDHRIVMSAAIAAIAAKRSVTITGAEAIRKSYPTFFEDYQSLGGEVHVL